MKITVTDPNNITQDIEADEGWRVMEIIRDHGQEKGLSIRADCGGCCACATCHVYVAEEWLDKITPMNDEEDALLADSFYRQPNSRLSCQITMTEDKDGLAVTIAPDAV